jgi:hypothetical protein
LVQDADVGVKKDVAPSKRSHCCIFGMVSPGPHRVKIADDG